MGMKKAVAVLTILTTVTVFFCSSVFAQTSTSVPYNVASTYSVSGNNVIYVSVATLYPEFEFSEGQNNVFNEGTVSHLVTVRIVNGSNKSIYYPFIPINISFTTINSTPSASNITDIVEVQNCSGDFSLGYLTNGESNLYCIPNVDFSFTNRVCIPVNTTLSCVAIVKTRAYKGNPLTDYAYASSVSIVGSPVAYETDFTPLGSHTDLLISLEAVRAYLSGTNGIPSINSSLNTINTTINSMQNQLHTDITNFSTQAHNDATTSHNLITDIKNILTGDSTNNNNISSDSGTLKTESDTVHQQEQAFFNANDTAIQNTGLSNYRFSSDQSDGVGVASTLFTRLWNATGDWSSVYIFSMTLSLALMIIRHTPSVISRRRKTNDNP